MNSIIKAVEVRYDEDDVPEPYYRCPVVIDPSLLVQAKCASLDVAYLIKGAAAAVELVSRFERKTRYVEFSCGMSLPPLTEPLLLRVRLVAGRVGHVARIERSRPIRGGRLSV